MHIILLFVVAVAVRIAVILPVRFFQNRGGVGAKREYERAVSEINRNGGTVVRAGLCQNVELDVEGLQYKKSRFLWLNISRPLVLDDGLKSRPIVYYHWIKNKNFGKRRILADTINQMIERRCFLPSFYKIGADRMLYLMNVLREQAHERASQVLRLHQNNDEVAPVKQQA